MPTLNDRDYYARRAIDVRTMADNATDPDIKRTLSEMASSYQTLVEEADRIERLKLALEKDSALLDTAPS